MNRERQAPLLLGDIRGVFVYPVVYAVESTVN